MNAIIFPLVPDRMREARVGLFFSPYSYSTLITVHFTHSVHSLSPLSYSIHHSQHLLIRLLSPSSFELNTELSIGQ